MAELASRCLLRGLRNQGNARAPHGRARGQQCLERRLHTLCRLRRCCLLLATRVGELLGGARGGTGVGSRAPRCIEGGQSWSYSRCSRARALTSSGGARCGALDGATAVAGKSALQPHSESARRSARGRRCSVRRWPFPTRRRLKAHLHLCSGARSPSSSGPQQAPAGDPCERVGERPFLEQVHVWHTSTMRVRAWARKPHSRGTTSGARAQGLPQRHCLSPTQE